MESRSRCQSCSCAECEILRRRKIFNSISCDPQSKTVYSDDKISTHTTSLSNSRQFSQTTKIISSRTNSFTGEYFVKKTERACNSDVSKCYKNPNDINDSNDFMTTYDTQQVFDNLRHKIEMCSGPDVEPEQDVNVNDIANHFHSKYKDLSNRISSKPILEAFANSRKPSKILQNVNSKNVSDSKSDTTKITDQIKKKLDAYDGNKMNKVKSKFGTSRGNAEVVKERVQKEILYDFMSDTNIDNRSSTPVREEADTKGTPDTLEDSATNLTRSVDRTLAAAKLSARVMDVPFTQFQKSMSSYDSLNDSTKPMFSTYDIVQKIKEVYKACSCKVCECIANVGLFSVSPKQSCDCKPCACKDCRSYQNKNYQLNKYLLEQKTLNTYDLKKRSEVCDCIPCSCVDCLRLRSKQLNTKCDCKPCDCIDCEKNGNRKMRTLIVAPVGDDNAHRYCQCNPCGCDECGFGYGHNYSSNMTQEMGTSAYYEHYHCHCDPCASSDCTQDGVDSCSCERHRQLMRKPVRSDKNDYDIRSALITNVTTFGRCYTPYRRNHETGVFSSYDNMTNITDYDVDRSNYILDLHDLNFTENIKEQTHSVDNTSLENHNDNRTKINLKLYRCDESCDWNTCESVQSKPTEVDQSIPDTTEYCDVSDINTVDLCFKTTFSQINLQASGTLVSDAEPDRLVDNSLYEIEEHPKNTNISNQQPQLFNAPEKSIEYTSEIHNVSQKPSLLCDDISNRAKTDTDNSEFYISVESSTKLQDTLNMTKINSKSPLKEQIPKSSESCNSSGHDNSDYLIRFPRSTVETCINDVMNLDPTINLINIDGHSIEYPIQKPEITESQRSNKRDQIIYSTRNNRFQRQRLCNNCRYQPTNCYCSETYLSEDSLYIRKNEITQTVLELEDRKLSATVANVTVCLGSVTNNTDCITDTQEKLGCLSDNYRNDLVSGEKTNINSNTNNRMDLVVKQDSLSTKINYESAENTIKEAKAFTVELLKLLHKYEKANKEFKSIADDLYLSHNLMVKNSHATSNLLIFEKPERDNTYTHTTIQSTKDSKQNILIDHDRHASIASISNDDTEIGKQNKKITIEETKTKRYKDPNTCILPSYKNESFNNVSRTEHVSNNNDCLQSEENTLNKKSIIEFEMISKYKAYSRLIKNTFPSLSVTQSSKKGRCIPKHTNRKNDVADPSSQPKNPGLQSFSKPVTIIRALNPCKGKTITEIKHGFETPKPHINNCVDTTNKARNTESRCVLLDGMRYKATPSSVQLCANSTETQCSVQMSVKEPSQYYGNRSLVKLQKEVKGLEISFFENSNEDSTANESNSFESRTGNAKLARSVLAPIKKDLYSLPSMKKHAKSQGSIITVDIKSLKPQKEAKKESVSMDDSFSKTRDAVMPAAKTRNGVVPSGNTEATVEPSGNTGATVVPSGNTGATVVPSENTGAAVVPSGKTEAVKSVTEMTQTVKSVSQLMLSSEHLKVVNVDEMVQMDSKSKIGPSLHQIQVCRPRFVEKEVSSIDNTGQVKAVKNYHSLPAIRQLKWGESVESSSPNETTTQSQSNFSNPSWSSPSKPITKSILKRDNTETDSAKKEVGFRNDETQCDVSTVDSTMQTASRLPRRGDIVRLSQSKWKPKIIGKPRLKLPKQSI